MHCSVNWQKVFGRFGRKLLSRSVLQITFCKYSNKCHRYIYVVVAQWLKHCTTNRKVAGSITDGVIGILHWHKPSSRTMALGSTQPLTELSTRNISWG
jgi:hypothetical protein